VESVKVPAIRIGYANGVSVWQHRLQCHQSRNPDPPTDPDGWLEAKDRLAKLIKKDFQLERKCIRKAQARDMEDRVSTDLLDPQSHIPKLPRLVTVK
jgi:hypothetical protein